MSIFGCRIRRAINYQFGSLNFKLHEKWNSKNIKKCTKVFFLIFLKNFIEPDFQRINHLFYIHDILVSIIPLIFPLRQKLTES